MSKWHIWNSDWLLKVFFQRRFSPTNRITEICFSQRPAEASLLKGKQRISMSKGRRVSDKYLHLLYVQGACHNSLTQSQNSSVDWISYRTDQFGPAKKVKVGD